MKGLQAGLLGTTVFLTFSAGMLSSCRKPAETVARDLDEAGYSLTTEDWFRVVRENDVTVMKKFIAGGFDIDTRDEAGDGGLHVAAAAGAEAAADYLLSRGCPIDPAGAKGRTPLMSAVMADKPGMVRWLLRQGANPSVKDTEGFSPLMLAVKEGSAGAVGELAPYNREDLDAALLLASLLGHTEVIDSLTNYGASVYARMDDGRTPLMLAAENGHAGSVELLLDIGAARLTTDEEGNTAADLAAEAGHDEVVSLLAREPRPGELSLDSTEEIASAMDAYVEAAAVEMPDVVEDGDPVVLAENGGADGSMPDDGALAARQTGGQTGSEPAAGPGAGNSRTQPDGRPSGPGRVVPSIDGRTLARPAEGAPARNVAKAPPGAADEAPAPLVMRHYREREVPLEVRTVENGTATIRIAGASPREVKVREGGTIPGSRLMVVRVQRRVETSKDNLGQPTEVSVVEVRDTRSGVTREWISGVPSSAHDPVALVEDAANGQRYVAAPGQRFHGADGTEYVITDVRPNQLVIEDASDGSVRTIPLSGPRG